MSRDSHELSHDKKSTTRVSAKEQEELKGKNMRKEFD